MQLDFHPEINYISNCIKLRKHKKLRHNERNQEKQRSEFFLIESMPNRNFAKLLLNVKHYRLFYIQIINRYPTISQIAIIPVSVGWALSPCGFSYCATGTIDEWQGGSHRSRYARALRGGEVFEVDGDITMCSPLCQPAVDFRPVGSLW